VPHDPLELLHVLVPVHGYIGVMGYMDCTLNNLMHLKVHPEQPPVHADQFDEPHESLGLLHVSLRTVMTENKLETNGQQAVEK
jgi:hypothetical protein